MYRLCCRWQESILPRICSEGALTKHAMVGEVMDQAGTPPLVRAQVLENTGTGQSSRSKSTTEDGQERKQ
jgi:hypothetical protein